MTRRTNPTTASPKEDLGRWNLPALLERVQTGTPLWRALWHSVVNNGFNSAVSRPSTHLRETLPHVPKETGAQMCITALLIIEKQLKTGISISRASEKSLSYAREYKAVKINSIYMC